MADNTTLPGTGAVVASDDVGAVAYQRVKLTPGPDGVAGVDVGGRTVDGGGEGSPPADVDGVPAPTVADAPSAT